MSRRGEGIVVILRAKMRGRRWEASQQNCEERWLFMILINELINEDMNEYMNEMMNEWKERRAICR